MKISSKEMLALWFVIRTENTEIGLKVFNKYITRHFFAKYRLIFWLIFSYIAHPLAHLKASQIYTIFVKISGGIWQKSV